jgi:hypothetical protein
MVGRVWPRHGHRGRPLNSVVSHHMRAVETQRVPIKWLLVPSIVVVAVAVLFGIAVVSDGGFINAHGVSGLMFMLFSFVALSIGALDLVLVGASIRTMLQSRELRTRPNLSATVVGAIPIVAGCWVIFQARGM